MRQIIAANRRHCFDNVNFPFRIFNDIEYRNFAEIFFICSVSLWLCDDIKTECDREAICGTIGLSVNSL